MDLRQVGMSKSWGLNIAPLLKHLVHKVRELLLQLVEWFPCGICFGGSCPLDKDFSASLMSSGVDVSAVQKLCWFWSELSPCIH